MEIRCKKGDCAHNTRTSCRAHNVKIDKAEAACKTYTPEKGKPDYEVKDGNFFKVAETIKPQNMNNVPLECEAKGCIYNKSEKCCANGITVISGHNNAGGKDAQCATFVQK